MAIDDPKMQANQRFTIVYRSSLQFRQISYSEAWTKGNTMAIHSEHNTNTTQTCGRDDGGLRAASPRILQLIAKLAAHVTSSSGARS